MYSTLVSVALFSALAIQGALADDFKVQTPSAITQCKDVEIKWDSTGASSYNVAIVPSDALCDSILADLGDTTKTSLTWKANIPAGQKVTISILDAKDNEAWSSSLVVEDSNDDSCLGNKSSSSVLSTVSSSSSPTGTTLVVNPAAGPSSASTAPAAPTNTDGGAQPVGAANSGVLGQNNGAFASVRFSALTVVLATVAALAVLAI